MSPQSNATLAFLLSRRSVPARLLTPPAPSREELRPLLAAAARVPDHGKLVPFRFLVLERPALARLAALVPGRGAALGIDPEKIAKAEAQYRDSPLAVAVIQVPRPADKVPRAEQALTAGAACLTLLNAALAAGWGANWLTGWALSDPVFRSEGLGLAEGEEVTGLVHIGTPPAELPPDRPRPDAEAITTWAGA